MKQLYAISSFLCLAALLAASCTTSLTDEPDTTARAIAFSTPQAGTRAAVNGTSLTSGSFDVWGWYGEDGANSHNVFDGETVSRSGNSWGYTGGTRYWIPGKMYNFYAVYPATLPAGTTADVSSDGTITVNGFDCSATGGEAVDLMTATAPGSGDNPQPVALEFGHELAKVNIVATVEGGNAIVTNITFAGIATSGDYSSTAGWSNTAPGSFTNSTDQILNTEGVDLLGDMLLIPQDVSGFTVTVDYTMDGIEQPQKVITLPTTISRWEAGQSYKYTLAFKGNNIIFTANVASWNHSTGGIITVE